MGYLYETFPFEMETLLEMLQGEEIEEEDALMKLGKLLAENKKKKN